MKKILAIQITIIFSFIITLSGCTTPNYSYESIFIHLIEGEQEGYYDANVLLHYSTDGEINEDYSNIIAEKFTDELEKELDTEVELVNNDLTHNEVGIAIKNFATLSKSGWSETYMITLQKEVGELTVFYPDTYEYKDYNTRTLPHVRHKYSPEISTILFQSENRKIMYDECAELYNWNIFNQKFMNDIIHFTLDGLFEITYSDSISSIGIPFKEIDDFNNNVEKFSQEEWNLWQKQTNGVISPFTVGRRNENNDDITFWMASKQMSELIQSQNELIEITLKDDVNYYNNLKELEENLENQKKQVELMQAIVRTMPDYSTSEIDSEFIVLADGIVSNDMEYVINQIEIVKKIQNE